VRGQGLYRLAWTWAVVALLLAGVANAASIQPMGPPGAGVAGIAAVGPEFAGRRAWVADSQGGPAGVANPGESVYVHVAMQNVGFADAVNMRMTIATDDPDVGLSSIYFHRPHWPVGDTRDYGSNAVIAATAVPHDVTAVVTVTADNGGPWVFGLTFPIVASPLAFVRLDGWMADPAPDGDGDDVAEPGERVRVGLRLRNDGTDDGVNVRVTLTTLDPDIAPLTSEVIHTSWPAGAERDTVFLVDIAGSALSHSASMFITVTVDGVEPWQFSVLFPIVGRDPEFEFRSFWLFDPAPGGNRDGRAVPGERVLPRVRLRNVGSAAATDVSVELTSDDPDVTVVNGSAGHQAWPIGDVRNNEGLVLDISSDATPRDIAATVTVSAADGGPWRFPVTFAIAPPDAAFSHEASWVFDPQPTGNRDGNLSPGERAFARVRLRNVGSDDAFGVLLTLATDDPDITVVADRVTHERWPAGVGRNNTGFELEVSSDALPHEAMFTVTVTTAHAGPWQFTVALPLVHRTVEFAQRSSWVFDPAPGGDRDGQAEAGERVLPRLRLRHIGVAEARNVRVSLTTDDPDVTVISGAVVHDVWQPGEARNNYGPSIDIAPLATPHVATLTMLVQAGRGESWSFVYEMPIKAPPVQFGLVSTWLDDDGNHDGIADAGERVSPRARLRHMGYAAATNVRAVLEINDPEVTKPSSAISIDTWNPGDEHEITDLALTISRHAIPRLLTAVLLVTADGGGSWQFEIPMPMSRDSGLVAYPPSSFTAAPGATLQVVLGLRNEGKRTLRNVQSVLTVTDPDVTVVQDSSTIPVVYTDQSRQVSGWISIAADATPHEITMAMRVTADYSDAMEISWPLTVAVPETDFERRSIWVWDPTPGGDSNGQVNPGERVLPRVRLRNVGGPVDNVRANLIITDSDVDVVSGSVAHDTWPAGEARNNTGFVLDILENATPHDVRAALIVTADGGRLWRFAFTIPIVADQVAETALLANYPNPFNPETWIPFDLSEAADVTVTVYTARGIAVRRLDLGRLAPGTYRGRADAAYWDGRNEVGEQASSGVYLYELRAGAHREMRRMVVRK
jgi:hypothetical protein